MKNTFRTEIKIEPVVNKINLKSRLISMGSCFADNISTHQSNQKLHTVKDPLGIAFNPVTLAQRITDTLNQQEVSFKTNEIIENNGLHFHFRSHSSLNSSSQKDLTHKLNLAKNQLNKALLSSGCLILTFGTAFVHELKDSGEVVANCHKQNPSLFNKKLLTLERINDSLSQAIEYLNEVNPTIKIITTVSPVRHTKEGLAQNSISKALLRTACHLLQEKFNNVTYFPSYEIMLDDLRSYRFYESDLIHPNSLAKEYIFNLFEETYYDQELLKHVGLWHKISLRLNHRPLHPSSSSYVGFLETLLSDLKEYPYPVDCTQEKRKVRKEIDLVNNLSS